MKWLSVVKQVRTVANKETHRQLHMKSILQKRRECFDSMKYYPVLICMELASKGLGWGRRLDHPSKHLTTRDFILC